MDRQNGSFMPGGSDRPPVIAHLVGELRLGLAAGIVERGDDQVLEDLDLLRLEERRVDLSAT